MSSPPPCPLFVIGSGPLIGAHTARLFATKNFTHIALFARSSSNLAHCSSFITSAAPSTSVYTYVADVTSTSSLTTAIEKALSEVGKPEVVLYNAARIQPSKLGEYVAQDMVEDFKVPNLGLYITATVLLPHLLSLSPASDSSSHPCLFVTSGAIIHEPLGQMFSLSMAKAAQATLVKVLREEGGGKVHVAMVTVGGPVGSGEGEIEPERVAEEFWKLWSQKEKGEWEGERRCGW